MAKSVLGRIGDIFRKLTGTGSNSPARLATPSGPPEKPRVRRDGPPRKRSRRRKRGGAGAGKGQPRAAAEAAAETGSAAPSWDPSEFTVPPQEGKVRFHDLDLPVELMRAIYDLDFEYCTPIQAGILAHTLSGKDATGRAQTGTGKTAAFLITILSRLLRTQATGKSRAGSPRALILAPTRELVLQIEKDATGLAKHTEIAVMAVFGGMLYGEQMKRLSTQPVDIVTATPGRLLDFKRKKSIDLSKVEILVIDEADRMLDMGFIPDVRRIIESTPMKGTRQTLFFSATLTPEVNRLAASWTRDPVHVDVTPPQETILSSIDQMVYTVTDDEKFKLLCNLIIKREWKRVMVFANRRDETQFLKNKLAVRGIRCGLLSGDVTQEKRVKTLEGFRAGRFEVLVATDVASRGLHIEDVSHVVNYSLPMDPQDYVHRIGRTGRAGATGTSVIFATETEAYGIPDIEAFIGMSLRVVHPEEDLLTPLPPLAEGVAEPKRTRSRPTGPGSGRRGPGSRSGPRRGPGGGRSSR